MASSRGATSPSAPRIWLSDGDGIRIDGANNIVSRNRIGIVSGNKGKGIFGATSATGSIVAPDNVVGNNRNGIGTQAGFVSVIASAIGTPGNGNTFEGVLLVSRIDSLGSGNTVDSHAGHGIRWTRMASTC